MCWNAAPDLEAKYGVWPQLRIGLNTGAAVVGRVQQAADAGITVLGDTVNFAARLQALAEPDFGLHERSNAPPSARLVDRASQAITSSRANQNRKRSTASTESDMEPLGSRQQ